MKQHTILLVACLMTVPAVAAEEPDDGCTEAGPHCLDSPSSGGATRPSEACSPVEYSAEVGLAAPDAHAAVHPECIIR